LKRGVRSRIDVNAVGRSKIVAIPMRVDALVNLQDISGAFDSVPFEKPVNIVPIDRRSSIPTEVIREGCYAPEISPPGKAPPLNDTAEAGRPHRPKHA